MRGAGEARGEVSRLPEELRALGRSLGTPGEAGSETMVERVLGQILAEHLPVPVAEPPRTGASGADLSGIGASGIGERWRTVRRWARVRRRTLVAALCGLLTVLVLTPPVRAAVFDWFGFGGVEVRYDPSAVPSPGAEAPGCGRSVSLAQAGERAGFAPLVPDALGAPDTVEVTREPVGRFLMSLCWHENGRTIRLDEYPARLDIGFTKTVQEQPAWLSLSGDASSDGNPRDLALWFPRPHLLSLWLVDETGEHFTRSQRTAGPTLLWTHEGAAGDTGDAGGPGDSRDVTVTLRLEGVASQARALEIAKSAD
ncbi:hypothetical protein [Streptomyces sp. SID12488]|uniref:hypothetical protein n=1 Tax=Streptomyces sp. SID12488 TaxID=2706040 RepID=UPI0013DBC598|nr:hypothetical protein [Streptomyces sp. SID12488]NEA62350.1 hypothetical protein [Streptomyces sp. SID12488]